MLGPGDCAGRGPHGMMWPETNGKVSLFWRVGPRRRCRNSCFVRQSFSAPKVRRSLDNLKEFDTIYTITQGGPGIASETLYLYSYQVGFGFFKAGYGSALMVVVFMVVLVFNVIMNRMRLSALDR